LQVALYLAKLLDIVRPKLLPFPQALLRFIQAAQFTEPARQAQVQLTEMFAVGDRGRCLSNDLALHGYGLPQRRQGFLPLLQVPTGFGNIMPGFAKSLFNNNYSNGRIQ
jgi:hypothetical protein